MSHFLTDAVSDIRSGKQSWRVYLLVCTPCFATALVAGVLQAI